jgi:hypothetical protein
MSVVRSLSVLALACPLLLAAGCADRTTVATAEPLPERLAIADLGDGAAPAAVGRGLGDLLAAAISADGRFAAVSRDDAVDAPAGLLLDGTVTAFEPDCVEASLVLVSGGRACVRLQLRLSRSGRVLRTLMVEGTPAGAAPRRGDLPPALAAYAGTPMEQALRSAAAAAAKGIAAQ